MARFTESWSTTINRPAAEVYDYLADPTTHGKWSPKAYRVEDLQGPLGAVGSSFTSVGWVPKDAEHRNRVVLTKAVAGREIEFTSEDGGDKFINRFTLAASGSGTTVTRSADWPKPGGFLGAVFPLVATFLIGPDVRKGLGNLKANLESGRN